MVAATIRKIQAPNQEAAVFEVSGSPEELRIDLHATDETNYGSHCVNQLGTGVEIRCYHVGSLGDTCDTVTLCVSTYCCKHKCCCE